MVASFHRGQYRQRGLATAELMVSTAVFAIVSAALLLGFVALKRNYAATMDYATNQADQMRLSDYLAQDFRRAIRVDPPVPNDVTLYLPSYYDSTPARSPQTPVLDGQGGVIYGTAGSSVQVRYYLLDSVIYRKEGNNPAVPLAVDVQDFVFTPTDLGKVIKTTVVFRPIFRSAGASDEVRAATAFYNTTLLRNNRGVY